MTPIFNTHRLVVVISIHRHRRRYDFGHGKTCINEEEVYGDREQWRRCTLIQRVGSVKQTESTTAREILLFSFLKMQLWICPHMSSYNPTMAELPSSMHPQQPDCPTKISVERLKAMAAGLHALGIRKGDVVLVVSSNSIMIPCMYLGILSLEAILTTCNKLNTKGEMSRQIRDSNPFLIFTLPQLIHKVSAAQWPIILIHGTKHEDSTTQPLFSILQAPPVGAKESFNLQELDFCNKRTPKQRRYMERE
eukprot:Gb_18695 [translate_table: standard]